jgi:hypothetical protein
MNVILDSSCKHRQAYQFYGEPPVVHEAKVFDLPFVNQVSIIVPPATHGLETIRGVTIRNLTGEVMGADVTIDGGGTVIVQFSFQNSGTVTIF